MSSLLPILVSPQNSFFVIGGDGVTTGLLGQVSKGQSKPSSQTFAQAFSQVLHEQGDASGFLKHLQALISTRRHEGALPDSLLQNEGHPLKTLVDPETLENIISKVQAYKPQELPKELLSLASDSDILLEIARLLSPPSSTAPLVLTNEQNLNQNQGISFEQILLPGSVPTIPPSPLQGIQPLPRIVFQGHEFQQSGGNPTLGQVSQESEIDGRPLRNAQIPLPKVLEPGTGPYPGPFPKVPELGSVPYPGPLPKVLEPGSGLYQGSLLKVAEAERVPQQVSQGPVGKQASSGLNQEEALLVRTVVSSAKDVPSSVQQIGRFDSEDESQKFPTLQRLSTPLLRSHNVQTTPIPPSTALQAEGPAGFAGPGQTNQLTLKFIQGNSPVVGESSRSANEYHTTVPVDVVGESGLVAKGERAQSIAETSVKSLGVDPTNGQGLGSGMNHFSNSQSGFQQPHMFSGQGVGLRAFEERGVEFPAQALQRLQMDVQLSDNQRVMIDVGVQNKQVYAGLVMDHSILRNLANQFVPQLENQLSQVDLELQEFSAEVREERKQESGPWFDDSRYPEGQQFGRRAQDERPSTQNALNQRTEQGLHLLA